MAKRTKRRRRNSMLGGLPSISLATVLGMLPFLINSWNAWRDYGLRGLQIESIRILTGWDIDIQYWSPGAMGRGLLPIMGGILIHRFIGTGLGVNRALARAGIPLIRL